MRFKYWSVWVFFLYTVDFILAPLFLVSLASRNGTWLFSSSSLVNLMLPVGSTMFICCCSSSVLPVCTRQMISSTYRFQFLGLQSSGAVEMIFSSEFSMYKFTTIGDTSPWLHQTSAAKFLLQI